MTHFDTAVEVARPIDVVFAYAADPLNFPDWNSAVDTVVAMSQKSPGAGGRYLMHRTLPGGRAANELEIVAWSPPSEFVLRTTSGPTPFVYRYGFTPSRAGTRIELRADVELIGVAELAGALAARIVKRGVDANFATLRQILEAGQQEATLIA